MRILAVDPDEYYHDFLREALGARHELRLTRSHKDASLALKEFEPDAVITELLLSDRTGYDLLEDLRQAWPNKDFLTIIFTGADNLEDTSAALKLGVNRYLVKGRDTVDDLISLLLTRKNHV